MSLYDSKIQDFVEISHKVAAYNLVQCSSGNLSWRIEEDIAMLSASGAWLKELTAEQVAVCEISTGNCINDKTPTCESVFHLGILQNRPEMNVVFVFWVLEEAHVVTPMKSWLCFTGTTARDPTQPWGNDLSEFWGHLTEVGDP